MAIRQKTIEYAWSTDATSVIGALSSSFTSSTLVVSIPESGSRVFRSVWIEFTARDSQPSSTGRAVPFSWYSDVIIGGNTRRYNNRNYGGPTDTGEHYLWSYVEDLTNFFSASFTGSAHSMSYTFWYSGSGGTSNPNFTNITNKLYITYDYNDIQNRQVKTVHIPMDYTGSITSSVMLPVPNTPNMGQIPALDTFCPESNKSFKQIYISIEGTDKEFSTAGSAKTIFSASIDNGTITKLGTYENALQTQTMTSAVYDISTLNTSTTHSLWLGVSDRTTTDMQQVVPVLHVTYEYDHNTSTRILNSVQLGFTCPGYVTTLDGSTIEGINYFDFYVPESNVTLKQSSIVYYIGSTSAGSIARYVCNDSASARIGGYLKRVNGSLGYHEHIMRIDSQSIFYPRTASINFGSGHNTFRSSTALITNGYRLSVPNCYYLINYESDKHALGDGVHNKTIKRLQISGSIYTTATFQLETSDIQNNTIPEMDYYINFFGYMHSRFGSHLATKAIYSFSPLPSSTDYINSNDLYGTPEAKLEDSVYNYSWGAELMYWNVLQSDESGLFRRYPNQATESYTQYSYNFQSTRSFNITQASNRTAAWDVITYHSITYPFTGSISSYTGDGSGITVAMHDAETGKVLKYTTSSLGGAYTMSWYDRSKPLYVEAIQDSTHAGRSANAII